VEEFPTIRELIGSVNTSAFVADFITDKIFQRRSPGGASTVAHTRSSAIFEHDQGLFLGPGVDIFAIIPLSNFREQYPEAKELVMLFTVPNNVNIELAQGEVIQAMRRLPASPPRVMISSSARRIF
jgi:hypothetical protein